MTLIPNPLSYFSLFISNKCLLSTMLVSRNRRVKKIDAIFKSFQSKGEENRGNIALGLDFSLPLYTEESGPKVPY